MKRKTVDVNDIPCYAVYADDSNFSDSWGNKLVSLWIHTKQALGRGEIAVTEFRNELINGIIKEANWRDSFEQAAREVGADPDDDELYEEYVALHRASAFELIPHGLHAEFCYMPEWDGRSLDELMDTNGLRSDRWKSNYIDDIQPGEWLAVFLRMVNVSAGELIGAAITTYGDAGWKFAEKCGNACFVVPSDPARPRLMSGEEVIAAIENAHSLAVPTVHCEMDVHALFEHDPTQAMRIATRNGKVHLGFHDGVLNGTGYMDAYDGEVVVPADATGFFGEERQRWSVNRVYGIVRSYFRATPAVVGVVS